ncbi:Protein of unknown function DUF2065 [Methylophilaceae bacterium]|jgi:uncharacterized protein YjeT (DUF2065 family)
MQASLFTAVGLMLVLEGLMPLLLPQSWREAFQRLMAFKDGQLRFVGLLSVLAGLLLIWVTNR